MSLNENNVILGTMNIALEHSSNKDENMYKEIIHTYLRNNVNPILDSAYFYGNTKTEEILGNILNDLPADLKFPKLTTKANPWFENDFSTGKLGQLSKENLFRQLTCSLNNLKIDNVYTFFLHCPDYETPIVETLEICNELYRKEKFEKFGLSNFSLDQTKNVFSICEQYGYVKPKIYQGMYNIICRKVEEIFPFLENNNMDFWGYNPLAGGLLTGKYRNNNINSFDSRFKNNSIYQNIFYKPEINQMLEQLWDCDEKLYIEKAMLWYKQNSLLRQNDSIILGVSSAEQYNKNMICLKNENNYNFKDLYMSFYNVYKLNREFTPNYFY